MLGDRWGVTDGEVARHYPCDDVVASPALSAWRGVTVDAPPERVWPWVVQLRSGPYSYDWIDNLGRRSPRVLQGLADPMVGEPFMAAMGGRPMGRVLAVETGVALTGQLVGAVISYVLVPEGNRTRLLLKLVTARGRFVAPVLALGDLVMARRQLLNLAALAALAAAPRP